MLGSKVEVARIALCSAAIAIGITVMIGWQFDIRTLKSFLILTATMKVNTALSVIALGTSNILMRPKIGRPAKLASGAISLLVLALSIATISEYSFGINLHIDEIFYSDILITKWPYPGRMSIIAAISFLFLALGNYIVLLARDKRAVHFGQSMTLFPLSIGYLSIVAYAYGTENLYNFGPFISLACNTAICLLMLGIALGMTRVREGFLEPFIGRPIATSVLRRTMFRALMVPSLTGFIIVLGVRAGLYRDLFGPSLFALATALSFIWLAFQSSNIVKKAEDTVAVASAEVDHQREAARVSEALFHQMSDVLPNIVWTAETDGLLNWYNRRTIEYAGLSMETLLGEGWVHFLHPDDLTPTKALWGHSVASGESFHMEQRLKRYDGEYRWFLTRAEPVRNESGEIVRWIGANTDIHDQKVFAEALERRIDEATQDKSLIEEQLRQSQKMEAVGQLTGGLAHDFNNLLMGISGSLELIGKRIQDKNFEKVPRHVSSAMAATARAATLTNRLLAFSRRQTLDPHPIIANDLVANVTELVERTVGPGIEVRVIPSIDPWRVRVDTNQLENSLLNLCINARDAMPDGGRLTIEIISKQLSEYEANLLDLPLGEYVKLRVVDTGIGMTPEVAARAFDPFFTTKPTGHGTGLGLSMVYGFVRQSGGRVRIVSKLGHGTQITITLPRVADGPLPEVIYTEAPVIPVVAKEQVVLLVEDEAVVRLVMLELLEELGIRAIEAGDSKEGLRILQSGVHIDLLVSDVGLPGGMNGRQMADAARETRPDLKVLFVTGYAEKAAIGDQGLPTGMSVITKPFALDTIGKRISDMLLEEYRGV